MKALRIALTALVMLLLPALAARAAEPQPQPGAKKIAAIVTAYFHNSHADGLVSRLFQTDTLDGKGEVYEMRLVSLYTDQVPKNDVSRRLASEHGFTIYDSIADALTLGTGELAVDGVLLIGEHGQYPRSPTAATVYPKRRFFEEVVKVFQKSGRVVPVFSDKHLADNWEDAKWIYDTAQRMKIPMMAGSSVPQFWRRPPADVERGSEVEEILAVSYHTLDSYSFHALELVQALAEKRKGGETGVKAVRYESDDAVWRAGEQGVYNPKLLEAAMSRLETPQQGNRTLKEAVPHPELLIIEYADGLRASVLTLNGSAAEWSAAWKSKDGRVESTLCWREQRRPLMYFSPLMHGVERMMLSGKPAWPVERTLMTSGLLDTLMISKARGGERIETPYLGFGYQSDWEWTAPPPPPPGRPLDQQ